MENKIQALLIEAAHKIGTAINYSKCITVYSEGIVEIEYLLSYMGGEAFEYMPVANEFNHSMEVVIYLESLINPS